VRCRAGLLAGRLRLAGWPWNWVASLNDNFATLGYLIIGIFAVSWGISLVMYRLKQFDEISVDSGDIRT